MAVLRARTLRRSLLLGGLLAGLSIFLLVGDGVQRLDKLFYDTMVGVHQRPANEELLIVAIDENSLRSLGRWPWSRSVHAQMIDTLTAAGASAIGIDVLFSEEDTMESSGDAKLASAMELSGKVVLAVGPESENDSRLISEVLPTPDLAASAALLGHIDFELDKDGISRRVYLKAGLGDARWPIFGLALLNIAHPEIVSPLVSDHTTSEFSAAWVRRDPMLVAYAGPPGHIPKVSFVDVLEGRVPQEQLRNRIILIGATAIGLGDSLSTPLSGSQTTMSGIEANANVLATLMDKRELSDSGFWSQLGFNLLLLLVLMTSLLLLPVRFALAAFISSALLTLSTSLALLFWSQVWYSPSIPLLLQTALYIIWTRMELSALKRLSSQLRLQVDTISRHDRITGLENRPQLEQHLENILAPSGHDMREFTLLILSMGRHRSVIDLLGIEGNDQLHQKISRRLARSVSPGDRVYRLDGAEFAVLIDHGQGIVSPEKTAAKLVQSLLRPFNLEHEQFTITPSIGSSQYPFDGESAREIIDNAYTAMHQARRDKIRSFCMYSPQIKASVDKQSRLHQDLRHSVDRGELVCLYQPQIDVKSGHLTGVETLVRWKHPTLGEISPADFIPQAEQEGVIVTMGQWVLRQACAQGQAWNAQFGKRLRVAVNVSAVQLNSTDLVDTVSKVLIHTGMPASSLELELTESALLSDEEATLSALTALKRLGLELAIDDFGTGYSSLTYLKNFPIDRIKIDQSFINDIDSSNESAEITRSIVSMTQSLGLEVIAEGVERQEHLAFLKALGCEEAQGFFIGKPMTADDLKKAIISGEFALA